MEIKFRVDKGQQIRDASGRYGCPNLNCWREHFTSIFPDTEKCPTCGVSLDWSWITFNKEYPSIVDARIERVLYLAKYMAGYIHHSGYPVYDGGHSEPEELCQHEDCKAVRGFVYELPPYL
jgi:hypothetical protein